MNTNSQVRIISNLGSPDSCYIYGILGKGTNGILKSRPIGRSVGAKIYTITYRDISALVSRSPYIQYDPSEENLLIHNRALQEAHSTFSCTVLPLRFSSVAKSESDVIKILSNGYPKFKTKLEALWGKVEVAVKVLCSVDVLRMDLSASGSLKNGEEVDEAMKKESYRMASEILELLKPLSTSHLLNELVFDDMIMNAAFLLDEAMVKDFLATVNLYDRTGKGNKYLKIQLSGPYVPYSFTEPES